MRPTPPGSVSSRRLWSALARKPMPEPSSTCSEATPTQSLPPSRFIDVNAGNSVHVGSIGNAATMKLAINGLFAAQVAAFAEIAGFIERSNLDTDSAMKTLAALPITSTGLQRVLGLIDDREYEPNFPVHLVAKDLGYLAEAAREISAAIPIVDATRSIFDDGASNAEERDLDIAGIARRYQTDMPIRSQRSGATEATRDGIRP